MRRFRSALAIFSVAALLLVASVEAADITGTWSGKTDVPNQGPDQITLVLKKASGSYSGTISDSLGSMSPQTEIKDVTWTDNVLAFSFPLTDGAIVKISARLEGGKLTGQWTHEQGSKGDFVLEKSDK